MELKSRLGLRRSHQADFLQVYRTYRTRLQCLVSDPNFAATIRHGSSGGAAPPHDLKSGRGLVDLRQLYFCTEWVPRGVDRKIVDFHCNAFRFG